MAYLDRSAEVTASGAPRAGGAGRLAGRTVSRIGFGAMQLERLRNDRKAAVALLRRCVELGIDHFDTAQFYGHGFVNEVIREAIREVAGAEDDVMVVSKVGAEPDPDGPLPLRLAQRPEQLRAAVEDNLATLGMGGSPWSTSAAPTPAPACVPKGARSSTSTTSSR